MDIIKLVILSESFDYLEPLENETSRIKKKTYFWGVE